MLDSPTAFLVWAEHNILTFLLPAYERPKNSPVGPNSDPVKLTLRLLV